MKMAMHGTNPHTRSIKQAWVITGGGNHQSACHFKKKKQKKAWSTYALVHDYWEYLQKKQRKQGLMKK